MVDYTNSTNVVEYDAFPAEVVSEVGVPDIEIIDKLTSVDQQPKSRESKVFSESLDISKEANGLINDIATSFELTWQELLSESLTYISTAVIKNNNQEYDNFDSTNIEEENAIEPLNSRPEPIQNPIEKIASFLEQYEPDVREQEIELINSIYEVVNKFKSANDFNEENKQQLIIEINQIIHELFSVLEIELEDEHANRCVELFLLNLANQFSEPEDYDINYLNRMGTREYKPMISKFLLSRVMQTVRSHLGYEQLIGKYTIQVSLI